MQSTSIPTKATISTIYSWSKKRGTQGLSVYVVGPSQYNKPLCFIALAFPPCMRDGLHVFLPLLLSGILKKLCCLRQNYTVDTYFWKICSHWIETAFISTFIALKHCWINQNSLRTFNCVSHPTPGDVALHPEIFWKYLLLYTFYDGCIQSARKFLLQTSRACKGDWIGTLVRKFTVFVLQVGLQEAQSKRLNLPLLPGIKL